MKKTLLLTGVLLALTAPLASAAGINLAWNNCFPTGLADLSTVGCNTDPLNNGNVYQMYGSVVLGISIPDVASQSDVIDLQVANPVLDDWWMMAAGECRDGSLSIVFQGAPNATTCVKTLFGGSIVPLSDYASKFGLPNRARLRLVCSRVTGAAANATSQYQIFNVNLDGAKSAFDPADPGTTPCNGCEDPACIVFNSCLIQGISGSNNLYTTPNSPGGRQHVTWQGGNGTNCPQSTPTHKATWGKVKSLYR